MVVTMSMSQDKGIIGNVTEWYIMILSEIIEEILHH